MFSARLLAVLLLGSLLACNGGPATPDTPGPALPSTSLGESTVGAPFSRSLAASGGTAPLSYSAQGLPAGIALDPQTGTLSGSPSSPGSFDIAASVTDAAGRSDQRSYPLLVLEAPHFVTASLPPATATVSYAVRTEASGGKAPLVYGLGSGSLPPGVAIDASGTLSGTPSAPGTYSFELSVTDAHGSVHRASFTLEVHQAPPIIVTSELTSAHVAREYRFTFSASGGTPPYSWSKVAGELPAGLAFSTTGELSGTPILGGTFSFTAEVRDANGQTGTQSFSLRVSNTLTLTSGPLPDAYTDGPYAHTLTAVGGLLPYRWGLVSGSLPPGISLSTAGQLSGTPSAVIASIFSVSVTDADNLTAGRSLSLTAYAPPVLAAVPARTAYVSDVINLALSVSGGKTPYSFSSAGSLPPGLSLGDSSGLLQGTLTTPGSFSFNVTATDANGRTSTHSISFTVHTPPAVTTSSLAGGYLGSSYSATLTATGGNGTLSWNIVDSPPPGLTLSTSGILSGTPTSAGSFTFTVRVTDSLGRSDSHTLSLTVGTPPRITTASLPDGILNTPYNVTLTFSGGRGTLSWGYSGTLPPGLTFGSDGSIFGTPTTVGTGSFTVTLQDSEGGLDSRVFPLTVRASAPDAGPLFTLGHWNIEWFGSDTQGPPRSTSPGGTLDDLQIANARDLIADAGVNLWGLVEMVDTADFQALKAQLPGYNGFLSDDPLVTLGSNYYGPTEQKLGVLYDSRLTFQSATLILTRAANDFAGRPPMRVDFTTSIQGSSAPLTLIVLHMKAFADQASYDRRQRASAALKSYLDSVLPTSRVFVVGDWNDDVDVSITYDGGVPLPTPYENFVAAPNDYSFITRPLSLAGEGSTTGFPDMIDHTLASNELVANYLPNSVHVLRPTWIPDYDGTTSDHYPVLSQYVFDSAPPPPPPPPPYRVFINEFLANEPSGTLPDGGFGALVDYEFVELVNTGPQPADLSGWTLWDGNTAAGARHVFSSGTVLQPGKAWVIYGGPTAFPPGTPNTEAASSGRLGLNNTGTDQVTLRDSANNVVNEHVYSSTEDNISSNRATDADPDAGFVRHLDISATSSSPGRRANGAPF
jgi:hypothetical protein